MTLFFLGQNQCFARATSLFSIVITNTLGLIVVSIGDNTFVASANLCIITGFLTVLTVDGNIITKLNIIHSNDVIYDDFFQHRITFFWNNATDKFRMIFIKR